MTKKSTDTKQPQLHAYLPSWLYSLWLLKNDKKCDQITIVIGFITAPQKSI